MYLFVYIIIILLCDSPFKDLVFLFGWALCCVRVFMCYFWASFFLISFHFGNFFKNNIYV